MKTSNKSSFISPKYKIKKQIFEEIEKTIKILEKEKENAKDKDDVNTINLYLQDIEILKQLIITEKATETTCIMCGMPSNGYHFCKDCYSIYSNKEIVLKINKCKEFTQTEEKYASDLICDDGHLVKSPYEKIIDNWLYNESIRHAYEKKIELDMNTSIKPDFYITDYGTSKKIYVEFWGYGEENKPYQKTKEYKHPIYQQLVKDKPDIAVVYLYKENVNNDEYKKIIKFAKPGEITEITHSKNY